uniref:Uncharacterized protein n=1 Tax=Anguilla anguilla TaxID=7936 RepID=A0A0E9X2I7_ANGAN
MVNSVNNLFEDFLWVLQSQAKNEGYLLLFNSSCFLFLFFLLQNSSQNRSYNIFMKVNSFIHMNKI